MMKLSDTRVGILYFLSFHIDTANYPSCAWDYLEVGSRIDTVQSTSKRLCGYTRPIPINLDGNDFSLKFHSDATNARLGFKIKIQEGKSQLIWQTCFESQGRQV